MTETPTPPGEPSQAEIRAECLAIQSSWTPAQEWEKRVETSGEYADPDEPDPPEHRPEWWEGTGRFDV